MTGARWRRIYSNDWHAGSFQALSDAERVVYFYGRTGPQSTSVGIYRMSTAVAVEDIGNLTAIEFDSRLDVVCAAFDWRFDAGTRVMWIPTWLEENPPQSPNVCVAWRKMIANLPDCDLKFEAAEAILKHLKDKPKAFLEHFGKDFPKDIRISKAKPKAQAEANQGAGDSGIQRSGKKRTGALRAGAENESNSSKQPNGNSRNGVPRELRELAREALAVTGPNNPMAELVEVMLDCNAHRTPAKRLPDVRKADALVALSAVLADMRAQQ